MKLNDFLKIAITTETNGEILIALQLNEIYYGSVEDWLNVEPDSSFKIVRWCLFENIIEFEVTQ